MAVGERRKERDSQAQEQTPPLEEHSKDLQFSLQRLFAEILQLQPVKLRLPELPTNGLQPLQHHPTRPPVPPQGLTLHLI